MADKQAGGLSLRIGLTLSQLQSDFLAAEQTVKQGMAALNRQQNIIKLKMETDTAGLDRVKDATKIVEIQEQALSQVLAMQRDKLTLATKAYQEYANSKNANEVAAKKLETAMEKERLAVARLETQLKNLSAQKISIDTTQLQEKISRINAKINNVRIKAEIDTSQLSGANAAFESQRIHVAAVTRELELQRQKLMQLREAMQESIKNTGVGSLQSLNFRSNVLKQVQEVNQLEQKLKELKSMRVDLQIRADSIKQAEQLIHDNIARLNAKLEHIRVQTDIDVSKIGSAASEFNKAKIQVQGLNRELDLQNQKLAEIKKALSASISANGKDHFKTINLQTDILKQIQAIDQLKAKIDELNKIAPPKSNNLLGGYLNIKGDVTGKLNQLTSSFYGITQASQSADSAITKSLEIIGAIPHPVGKAVAAFAAIPLVIKGVEHTLLEMAKPAIEAGDAFYVMSRGMQLSIADMGKLSTIAKVTGIDINEVNATMRRFSTQMTKAGEKSLAVQTLQRYGAEIYDINGRLKNALELSDELGKALKAAEAEGNGAAFRDIVGGKFWSGDFITYLEDFADNVEQAKKVVKNGLANPTWAHAIQGEINTLNAQIGQLGGAFSAALMPVVAEIVPHMREQFGELTKVIAANKENIKFLGDAMALPVRMLYEITDGVMSLSKAIDTAKDKGTTLGKVFAEYGKYRDDLAALMNVAPTAALTAIFSPMKGSTDLAIAAYREEIDEFKKAQAKIEQEANAKNDERQKRIENSLGLSGLTMEQAQQLEGVQSKLDEERIKREQETADIIYKINHTSYENNLRDLERWKEEQLRIIEETEEQIKAVTGKEVTLEDERGALDDNYAAKQIQLEEEKEAKLAEIRQRIESANKTEIENRMIAIEDEKDAWIQAGMEKAEAEKLAEQQKADYIKNIEAELSAEIESLHQTDLEKRLSQIENEKQAWINKGASESQAEQLAQEKIRQEYQKTQEKLNEIRQSVMAPDLSEYEKQFAAIEKEKQAWIQLGMEKVEAEELAQKKIQRAYEETAEKERTEFEKNMQARAKAQEDYIKKVQAAQEEAERKNAALRNEALNVVKQEAEEFAAYLKGGYSALQKVMYDKLIKSGVDPGLLKQMTPEKLDAYKNAKEQAQRGLLPNWEDPYSAAPVSKSLNEIPPAADNAAKSLNELSVAAGNVALARENPLAEYEPMQGRGSDVVAYTQPDGSIKIENFYQDVQKLSDVENALTERLVELPEAVRNINENLSAIEVPQIESLSGIPEVVQGVMEELSEIEVPQMDSLSELPQVVQGVMEELSAVEIPQFDDLVNPFANMESEIENTIQYFSNMNFAVEEVVVKLNDLSAAIANFSLPNGNGNASATNEKTPVNVSTTVQIEEAHAWDYDHISELADKVADIIEPRIVSAVGGDSNSY